VPFRDAPRNRSNGTAIDDGPHPVDSPLRGCIHLTRLVRVCLTIALSVVSFSVFIWPSCARPGCMQTALNDRLYVIRHSKNERNRKEGHVDVIALLSPDRHLVENARSSGISELRDPLVSLAPDQIGLIRLRLL